MVRYAKSLGEGGFYSGGVKLSYKMSLLTRETSKQAKNLYCVHVKSKNKSPLTKGI